MDEKTAVSGLFLQCNFSILFGKNEYSLFRGLNWRSYDL